MDLKSLLKAENVRITEEEMGWRDAVHAACRPLVEQGYLKAEYPENIIKNAEEFGPYFVLAEDVAFLHARPDQGVISSQAAVLVSRNPVRFAEDGTRDARLLIVLGASDSEAHIEAMQALADLFSDEGRIQRIVHSKNEGEIYSLFIK